jgi:L-ascorbate metabolism protein UlaG (beta-lactamase superfamily)
MQKYRAGEHLAWAYTIGGSWSFYGMDYYKALWIVIWPLGRCAVQEASILEYPKRAVIKKPTLMLKEKNMRKISCVLTVLCIIFLTVSISCAEQNVCGSWTPAMVGGPAAQGKDLLSVRWIEGPNMELTYKNQVILLSAYLDRGPDFEMLTVNPKDVKCADAIFLGHGHGDHMLDAARIAVQTGAKIYAQKVTIDLLKEVGEVDEKQLVTVKDGDTFDFNGFNVEAVHMYHSGKDRGLPGEDGKRIYDQVPPAVNTAYGALRTAMTPPKSPAQIAWETQEGGTFKNYFRMGDIGQQMSLDVMGYLFTFGKDFTFFYHDSMNFALTDQLKDLMARIKKTDVASVAYAGSPSKYAVPWGMPETTLLNPHYVIPNHHWPSYDMDVIPYAVAIRNAIPGASLLSLMPNQVSCFNVKNHKLISDGVIVNHHDK